MRYLVVVFVWAAAVAIASSCDVGVAFNCFSEADCPEGQTCESGACVEGSAAGGDGSGMSGDGGAAGDGSAPGDGGGATGDGGNPRDGGVPKDGGVAKDGGQHWDAGGPSCEDPCRSTQDCANRCEGSSYVCREGFCEYAECWNDSTCEKLCAPYFGTCVDEFCQCWIEHYCSDECGNDEDCAQWCGEGYACEGGSCVQTGCLYDEECMELCEPWAGYCEDGTCLCEAGECRYDSDCAKLCSPYDGKCSNGSCICGGCVPDCSWKECGDDGCGGSCGTCGPGLKCFDWQCTGCTPACGNSVCGGPDGCGGYCPGQCPDASQECVQDPGGGWTCVSGTCDPYGKKIHEACTAQEQCACGNDCVIFGSAVDQPQSFGECLAHCADGGSCADPADLCMCTEADPLGVCTSSSCFPQGTLKGNFAGKVLNSCQDQPGQTDIGSGNMSLSVAGKNASFNLFLTCHFVDGASDYVVVQGLKMCGQQICPDVLILGIVSADVKVGTINYQSGSLFTEWMQYTFIGQSVSDLWIRGYGVFGSVTLTAAGKTGKQPISGSADITMIGYNSEVCGGSTGIPCN